MVVVMMLVMGVLQVVAGGTERLEDDDGSFGREDGAEQVVEVSDADPRSACARDGAGRDPPR